MGKLRFPMSVVLVGQHAAKLSLTCVQLLDYASSGRMLLNIQVATIR
jgi:hypothetical protein